MYKGMLHLHITTVVLYLVIFLIKVIYLFSGNKEKLAGFRAKSKVFGEMVLPTIFLATGIFLAIKSPYAGQAWFIFKMILLVLATLLGIITFRRNNKALGIITLLIFIYMFALSFTKTIISSTVEKRTPESSTIDRNPVAHGKEIYLAKACTTCHGADGSLGLAGAADLHKSTLNSDEIENTIANGRANMRAYKNEISAQEIKDLAEYVKSLRN